MRRGLSGLFDSETHTHTPKSSSQNKVKIIWPFPCKSCQVFLQPGFFWLITSPCLVTFRFESLWRSTQFTAKLWWQRLPENDEILDLRSKGIQLGSLSKSKGETFLRLSYGTVHSLIYSYVWVISDYYLPNGLKESSKSGATRPAFIPQDIPVSALFIFFFFSLRIDFQNPQIPGVPIVAQQKQNRLGTRGCGFDPWPRSVG